jgi:hypothetical protein
MLKYLVAVAAFTAMCATPADAQTEPAPLLAVESMTCDQMNAEMMTAGMQMNSQIDTEGLLAENQAMQEEAERRRREQMSMGLGVGLTCAIPGLGAACTAASMAQASRAAEGVDEQHARMDRQIGRMNDSMAGLDQNRLMAMSERHQQMQCPTPQ